MRNKINLLIIVIAIILLLYSTIYGFKIGSFKVLSVSQMKEKDNELNEKINEASNLTTVTYPNNIEELEETFQKYLIQKQKYQELAGIVDEGATQTYETKQYDISYLWRVIGKYATSRNLTLNIDVQKSNEIESLYDFSFSVSGEYVNISQFIADLENNSDLFFRIYNFKMSGMGKVVNATFTVKDISIDPSTIIKITTQ